MFSLNLKMRRFICIRWRIIIAIFWGNKNGNLIKKPFCIIMLIKRINTMMCMIFMTPNSATIPKTIFPRILWGFPGSINLGRNKSIIRMKRIYRLKPRSPISKKWIRVWLNTIKKMNNSPSVWLNWNKS